MNTYPFLLHHQILILSPTCVRQSAALLSALLTCQDLEVNYSTIYQIVRYELKSKLKTPRPTHEKQAVGVVNKIQVVFGFNIMAMSM